MLNALSILVVSLVLNAHVTTDNTIDVIGVINNY